MKLRSPLLATALANLVNAQTPATAIVTIEASHGGAGSDLTNTTISIPLLTQYTNPALDTVSTLYLSGSTGAVQYPSITCYPYRNGNLTGMGGLPFTSETPSRLSTNSVSVGSIMCNSTDLKATSVTSTLSATTTDITRGSISDVPNLNSTTLLSATSSSRSNGTMKATSTFESLVPATSTGDLPPVTITSVSVVPGGSGSPVTSTMLSAMGATPSSSSDMNNGVNMTGAAMERWRVGRWAVVAVMLSVILGAS